MKKNINTIKKTASEPSNKQELWQSLQVILPTLKRYFKRVLIALFCLVLAKLATVGVPLVLKMIIDYFEKAQEQVIILPLILLLGYGALRLLAALLGELRDVVFSRVRYHAMRELSLSVLAHLHALSLRFHLDRKTGAISRDLERGTRSAGSMMNFLVFSILPTSIEFILVALILLVNYNVIFTLVTFGTVVLYVLFTIKVSNWRLNHRTEMNQLDSEGNNKAIDSLINYETVKYFNNEQHEFEQFDKTLTQWEDKAVLTQTSMSILNFGQAAIIGIGVTIVMLLATQGVANKSMTLGDLVMINAFMLQLFIPLSILGMVYRQMRYTLADMRHVFDLLQQPPEVVDKPDAIQLTSKKGHVVFDQVQFSYQVERPILKGLSFEVKQGKKIAIVGHSGAGKSTISRLLFRFYNVEAGAILVDGHNIADLTQHSLRQAIAIVPQDTVLFNASLFYNIQYGNMKASKEAVKQAAKMAHIDQFIESLPKGWDTIVGERGLKLSGGEKQRVAIARAILKQPAIMVFDEATSSLDSATEQAIQQTIDAISGQHSTVMIAHRLSTIVNADQILVMKQGQVIERGTHQSLLAKQGEYYGMWQLQQSR